ncbi:MAG TPA: hypothetical protein DD670_11985 [Planctomycetaceae bacterium]|nr:hypothetical protein [Planctomycetaceae bacterium]
MVEQHASRTDRREWLRTAARWSALGGLGVLGVGLVARGGDCRTDADCCQCYLFARCGLPQADDARRRTQR